MLSLFYKSTRLSLLFSTESSVVMISLSFEMSLVLVLLQASAILVRSSVVNENWCHCFGYCFVGLEETTEIWSFKHNFSVFDHSNGKHKALLSRGSQETLRSSQWVIICAPCASHILHRAIYKQSMAIVWNFSRDFTNLSGFLEFWPDVHTSKFVSTHSHSCNSSEKRVGQKNALFGIFTWSRALVPD